MSGNYDLVKEHWRKSDIKEFQKYLHTFENKTKKEWCSNILQTNLPILCIKTPVIKDIVQKIYKGSYLEFLDLMIWEYYENTAINGFLISKIEDFDTKKKYLNIYASLADNWATCDLLTFNIRGYEKRYYDLVLEYIKNDKPFVRRIGVYILFNFIDNDCYVNKIYKLLDKFTKEEDYYVNMMNSWLLCELFIKRRTETIEYLKNNKLNRFVINHGIQKCRDSRRVSQEDKDMLLKYKM